MSIHKSNRRPFLMGVAGSLALPQLLSFPSKWRMGLHGAENQKASQPMRMVCIGNEFGYHGPSFFPKKVGRDYEWTPLLSPLKQNKDHFSVFSGLDHNHKGGHFAIHGFLSGVKETEAKSMPEGNLSLDQKAAEFVGAKTRFPSIHVGAESGLHGGTRMCWTRSGARIPPLAGPRGLFQALFVNQSDPNAKLKEKQRMRLKASILDSIYADAKMLSLQLDSHDKHKLDEYFSSIRDVEKKLALNRYWSKVEKPTTSMQQPQNKGMIEDLEIIYDLFALALETDSTRIATLEVGQVSAFSLDIKKGYHALSHHGQVEEAIQQLVQIERYQIEKLNYFINKLKNTEVNGESLLEHTMILNGSGMGNANAHTNYNLPIILAGGGFKHGEYKVYPQKTNKVPLNNLFLSMLQRFGLEADTFQHSTGTLKGLEIA